MEMKLEDKKRINEEKTIMTYEEISKVLEINGEELAIYLPNELFSELQGYMVDSSHVAYAYSYMYLSALPVSQLQILQHRSFIR